MIVPLPPVTAEALADAAARALSLNAEPIAPSQTCALPGPGVFAYQQHFSPRLPAGCTCYGNGGADSPSYGARPGHTRPTGYVQREDWSRASILWQLSAGSTRRCEFLDNAWFRGQVVHGAADDPPLPCCSVIVQSDPSAAHCLATVLAVTFMLPPAGVARIIHLQTVFRAASILGTFRNALHMAWRKFSVAASACCSAGPVSSDKIPSAQAHLFRIRSSPAAFSSTRLSCAMTRVSAHFDTRRTCGRVGIVRGSSLHRRELWVDSSFRRRAVRSSFTEWDCLESLVRAPCVVQTMVSASVCTRAMYVMTAKI